MRWRRSVASALAPVVCALKARHDRRERVRRKRKPQKSKENRLSERYLIIACGRRSVLQICPAFGRCGFLQRTTRHVSGHDFSGAEEWPNKTRDWPRVNASGKRSANSARLGDQLCGQHGVHGARTKTLEIEGDVMETQLLENTSERGGHRRGESAWQLFASDLDAHDCTMVTHAILPESESA